MVIRMLVLSLITVHEKFLTSTGHSVRGVIMLEDNLTVQKFSFPYSLETEGTAVGEVISTSGLQGKQISCMQQMPF